MKKAILVISFGTSCKDALENSIAAVEKKLQTEFGAEVFRAFTSGMIIRKLRARDNIYTDTVEEALKKLLENGYTDVFCVPTHVINGEEYDKACAVIDKFKDKMNLRVSRPLISITDDYFEIVDIFSKRLTDKNRLYVFMGHGSEHFANAAYPALEYYFRHRGMKNVLIGTVEGFPDLETVINRAILSGKTEVTLMPLMLVCGDHAQNDMAVDWREAFEKNGFSVECDLTGLGEAEEIQNMYVNHLKEIWGH